MGVNNYIFVNGVDIYKFKAGDSKINEVPFYLRNVSKDFSADKMKKSRLHGFLHHIPVDYDSIDVADILDIQKYLTKKPDKK